LLCKKSKIQGKKAVFRAALETKLAGIIAKEILVPVISAVMKTPVHGHLFAAASIVGSAGGMRGGEVITMSTRAMICVDWYGHDHFELFYRHCDGYPTGLGQELIEAMLKHDSIQEVLKEVSAGPEGGFVERVEDAFLKVQSDLEWVYAIHNANDKETVSLQIFKTSNPYTTRQFIWPVWFSYKVFMKRKKALLQMSVVELTASNTLHALHEFEKAEPIPVLEDSKQAPEKQDCR
jgi:hypothetical protein